MNKFTQLIRFGECTQNQKTRVIDFISSLIIEEKKEYKITIEKYKENKSLEQLGYYFSTVVPVCVQWQGLENKEAHIFLKENCLEPVFFSALDGTSYQFKPSVKDMKVDAMAEYIDKCINFMGAEGQYTPPPRYKS